MPFKVGNKINYKHGYWGTPTYKTWQAMKRRVLNPKATDFKYYGGRGIGICSRWLWSFENFLHDMGERPSGMTLDRKDVNGNYTPDNCKWSTRREQRLNIRSKHYDL